MTPELPHGTPPSRARPGRAGESRQALLFYQSRVRRGWFDVLKCNLEFNIELIEGDLVGE